MSQWKANKSQQENEGIQREVNKFKSNTLVSTEMDKVDETSPLHPNLLLGRVTEVEDNYAKIVTKFGIISKYISTTVLIKCPQTRVNFYHTKQITFSSACKMAINQ